MSNFDKSIIEAAAGLAARAIPAQAIRFTLSLTEEDYESLIREEDYQRLLQEASSSQVVEDLEIDDLWNKVERGTLASVAEDLDKGYLELDTPTMLRMAQMANSAKRKVDKKEEGGNLSSNGNVVFISIGNELFDHISKTKVDVPEDVTLTAAKASELLGVDLDSAPKKVSSDLAEFSIDLEPEKESSFG